MTIPSSSRSSRTTASSGASPASILPPGNSHSPASDRPSGRLASSILPSASRRTQAATRTIGCGFLGLIFDRSRVARSDSRAVIGVDGDIVVSEVAGPNRRGFLADTDIHADRKLGPPHIGSTVLLAIGRRDLAILGDKN